MKTMDQSTGQTASQLLVRSLMKQGVGFIFGIPGGKIMPVFDVLNDESPHSSFAGTSKTQRSWLEPWVA